MSEHLSAPLAQAVRFIANMTVEFGAIKFPGTNISILAIMVSVWTIYFIWRWVLAQMFDVEVKK